MSNADCYHPRRKYKSLKKSNDFWKAVEVLPCDLDISQSFPSAYYRFDIVMSDNIGGHMIIGKSYTWKKCVNYLSLISLASSYKMYHRYLAFWRFQRSYTSSSICNSTEFRRAVYNSPTWCHNKWVWLK